MENCSPDNESAQKVKGVGVDPELIKIVDK